MQSRDAPLPAYVYCLEDQSATTNTIGKANPMGMIWRLIRWGFGLGLLTLLVITLFSLLYPNRAASEFAKADVIIVFGAGMDADGTLHQPSILRVRRGVALYDAGKAPIMHFTGGRAAKDGPSTGDQMADLAVSMGVPRAATTREHRSLSTLQNALFSQPDLTDAQTAILVSEGFHLPRVAAALLWAGGPSDVQLAPSTRFRGDANRPIYAATRMILREGAAWWFNTARALAYTAGGWMGIDQHRREGWLD